MKSLEARDRLIVALDFPTQAKALALVSVLSDSVSTYKIGLQLYTVAGPAIVQAVAATGAKIFLDLKLHDIPNTVAKAVAAAGELGVQMLTVH
ncbi:MAG: orotidine 5'-phosphate decarboxylase, partial [Verrucomicrobiaceae bacterium]|nr:orotidine 5'-phosphate decarboxylase [Verrucomicrobiaceae bacterium]